MAPRLTTPRLIVRMANGDEYDVQALNVDLVMYERTAAKRRWPPTDAYSFNWMTWLAWHALTREKQINISWDDFAGDDTRPAQCVEVTSDPKQTGDDAADPTRTDPEAI